MNNVGDYRPLVRFPESTPQSWKAMYDINLHHVFAVTHAFIGAMIEQQSGSIVNIHSVEGMRGYPRRPGVRRDEGGGRPLHDVSGRRARPQRHPSQRHRSRPHADTAGGLPHAAPRSSTHLWSSWAPIGRLGWPEDQARVALFLASDQSAVHHRPQHPRRWWHENGRRLVLLAVGPSLREPPDHPVEGEISRCPRSLCAHLVCAADRFGMTNGGTHEGPGVGGGLWWSRVDHEVVRRARRRCRDRAHRQGRRVHLRLLEARCDVRPDGGRRGASIRTATW